MTTLNVSKRFHPDIELLADVVAIVGRRGRGKTTTAVVLVEELARAGARFCVADPTGAWWGLKSSKDGRKPGLPVVVMGGDHGDVPLEDTAGRIIADFVAEPSNPSVVLDFLYFRKAGMTRFMADFLEELYHKNRDRLHLVFDEAEQFAPQAIRMRKGETGAMPRMLGAMEDVVKLGRVRGLLPVLITQRCASLNKNVLELAGMLVSHALTGPNDKKAVDSWVRDNASEQDLKLFHSTLAGLPRGTAWFWQPEAEVFERVEVRDRTTFDSSATPGRGKKARTPKVVAEVDLDDLKARIASTIEKAKAEDPKLLRKRIAELERELKAAQKKQPETERVEVPVLTGVDFKRLDGFTSALEKALEPLQERFTELLFAIAQVRDASAPPQTSTAARPRQSTAPAPRRAPSPAATAATNGHLAKGERIVLTAVAQHQDGVTKNQLSILTGYKRSSRDTYLQRLRQSGYVMGRGDQLTATAEGLAALGADFEPLPTGDELQAYWLEQLPAGERICLEPILDAYPDEIGRDELGVDYRRSSRDTYLQRLSARKLIETPQPGVVRASDTLFG